MNSPSNDGMSRIVKTVCGWIKGFVLLYGIHIIIYGHLTPGGGFAGGVIAAAAFVLISLAEGKAAADSVFPKRAASVLDSAGVLLFAAIGCLGLLIGGTFFVNLWATPESARFTLGSSGSIPFCNIGIGLKVCSSLFLAFLMLNALNMHGRPSTKEESS